MFDKTTDDLRQELMTASDLDTYLTENRDQFAQRGFGELLNRLIARKRLSKAALARESGMSEVYLYQMLSGRRKPSRDRLLCLCVGLGADAEEVRELLTTATCAQLYPRDRRDAIILHGILHHTPLGEINDRLFDANEKTLF